MAEGANSVRVRPSRMQPLPQPAQIPGSDPHRCGSTNPPGVFPGLPLLGARSGAECSSRTSVLGSAACMSLPHSSTAFAALPVRTRINVGAHAI